MYWFYFSPANNVLINKATSEVLIPEDKNQWLTSFSILFFYA